MCIEMSVGPMYAPSITGVDFDNEVKSEKQKRT